MNNNKKAISIYLDEELYNKIKEYAKANNTSINSFISKYLENNFNNECGISLPYLISECNDIIDTAIGVISNSGNNNDIVNVLRKRSSNLWSSLK